jgi:hypothetical protein
MGGRAEGGGKGKGKAKSEGDDKRSERDASKGRSRMHSTRLRRTPPQAPHRAPSYRLQTSVNPPPSTSPERPSSGNPAPAPSPSKLGQTLIPDPPPPYTVRDDLIVHSHLSLPYEETLGWKGRGRGQGKGGGGARSGETFLFGPKFTATPSRTNDLEGEPAEQIAAIWADPNVRWEFEHAQAGAIQDNSDHFLDKVMAISGDDRMPTDDDMVRTRVRTSGRAVSVWIRSCWKDVELIDVGFATRIRGMGRELRRLPPVISLMLFVVPLVDFDQDFLDEDGTTPTAESRAEFRLIAEEPALANTLLFLIFSTGWTYSGEGLPEARKGFGERIRTSGGQFLRPGSGAYQRGIPADAQQPSALGVSQRYERARTRHCAGILAGGGVAHARGARTGGGSLPTRAIASPSGWTILPRESRTMGPHDAR